VQPGDTVNKIVKKLGFHSLSEANFKVPSGDLNKIFPGNVIEYQNKEKKKKRKRFILKKTKVNLKKFCFKTSNSIHYRNTERCR
jgi:hypothetical protein